MPLRHDGTAPGPISRRADKKAPRRVLASLFPSALVLLICLVPATGHPFDSFDVLLGVVESPHFKNKDALGKLYVAAHMLGSKRLKHEDMAFFIRDWSDQYLREAPDPLERLRRWSGLSNDEKLRNLRIPRDHLNRMLLAEYLVRKPEYRTASPHVRLQMLGALNRDNLLDWTVALEYARMYAGGVISGNESNTHKQPIEALEALKKLMDDGLVSWHYRVPTEQILAAEALALDTEYAKGIPNQQLERLRDLEKLGLISHVTRREFEKLPAWRDLVNDPSFLKAEPEAKRRRIDLLRDRQLVSDPTCIDLINTFRLKSPSQPLGPKALTLPERPPLPAQ
ncbi:MAG: hypothetical protein V2B18_19515 [Pseudomonadota bacterium]